MIIEDITTPEGIVAWRKIVKASFEEWLSHVFDHQPQKGSWWWNEDAIDWAAPPSDTVAFMTKTFEETASVFKPFSEAQLSDGLYYISNESCSDISSALLDESVPSVARKNTIKAIKNLYTDFFAARCSPILSHLDEKSDSPLNEVCYMWWDVFPYRFISQSAARAELGGECLAVMEFAIGLDSVACRESALHGLGHWAKDYPDLVRRVIDDFIKMNPNERPELLAYAQRAREGGVL